MNKLIFKLFYIKAILNLLILIFAVFLVGCGITGKTTKTMPHETAKNMEAYFCPQEDCGKVFETHINSANASVHCAFYDINLKNMIDSLAKKSNTAEVKIVIDKSNYDGQIKGDDVKLDNNNQLMHNKFCIIDSNRVITGSFNPTDNDNSRNNNNILVIYSITMAKNYEDEFKELWNGKFGKGDNVKYPIFYVNHIKIENYFCPEDGCASHITKFIENAKSSIYFMSFSFTNEEIADALIKKNADVRGIFDSQQASSKYSQFKRMQEFGINAKKDKNKYKMHHKVFIIDNATVITGSFNPTLSGDTKNDENLLIVHDKKIADVFLKEFDKLWE